MGQPCLTFQYAIQKSKLSDKILLDAEYSYIHNNSLVISHSLTIESYCGRLNGTCSSQYANVSWNGDLNQILILRANLTMKRTLIIYAKPVLVSLFLLMPGAQRLEMHSCQFYIPLNNILYVETEDWKQYNKDIVILRTWFVGLKRFAFERSRHSLSLSFAADTIPMAQYDNGTGLTTVSVNDSHFQGVRIVIKTHSKIKAQLLRCNFKESAVHFITFERTDVEFKGCQFFSSGLEVWTLKQVTTLNVRVRNSSFEGSNTQNGQQQLVIRMDSRVQINSTTTIYNCRFIKATQGALKVDGTQLIVNKTLFIDNHLADNRILFLSTASALTATTYYILITDCRFYGNTAVMNQAQAMYILEDTTIDLKNALVKIVNTKVRSIHNINQTLNRDGTVVFIKTLPDRQGSYEIQHFTVECQNNEYIVYQKHSYNYYVIVNCHQCDGTKYNTGSAMMKWIPRVSPPKIWNIHCHNCPYQASCAGGVRSKGKYWGISNSKGEVSFTLCPAFYCCSSLDKCTSYNTCINNRLGRLCGSCAEGHLLSLFSQNRCVPADKCSEVPVWPLYTVTVIVVCSIALFYKTLLGKVKLLGSKLQRRIAGPSSSAFLAVRTDSPYHLFEEEETALTSTTDNEPTAFSVKTAGIIKITFFFYQVASIIRVDASAKSAYQMPYGIDFLTSFFNIRIDVSSAVTTGVKIDVCPFGTSSVVLIEAFRISIAPSCLLVLVTVMVACRILSRYTKYKTDGFVNKLRAAYVQLMLLGYSNVVAFCLGAVHCVKIADSWHLYIEAETVNCLQPWQLLTIVFITLWVIPFPFVLYAGSKLLRLYKITPGHFFVALTFPPYLLLKYISITCSRRHGQMVVVPTEKQHEDTQNVLLVLNQPFRNQLVDTNDDGHQGNSEALIWEPVLIGRRLVLLASTTFILSPIVKLYPAGVLLVLCTMHDHVVMPYKGKMLNLLQLTSMHLLVILTMVNTFWAYSNDIDFMENHLFSMLGSVFLIFELALLVLPVAICLFGLLYLFGTFVYKTIVLRKQD